MIRNIIFDIGNVLTLFHPEDYIHAVFDKERAARLYKALFESGRWYEIDTGSKTDEEMIQSFLQEEPALEKEIRFLFDHINGFITLPAATAPWISRLHKEGYSLYYLSNYGTAMRARTWKNELSVLNLFEGGIFSCDVHLLKPDPAIYNLLLNQYALNPADSVFLDDSPANVKTAEKLGMHAIHVEKQLQAIQDLDRLLKEENDLL